VSFVGWVERHVRIILTVAVALAVAGVVAGLTLPVGLFPRTSFPRVKITLNAGDRPADQMLLLVSRPVAEAIHTIPGLQRIRSTTSRVSAEVTADFGWGRDMIQTTQEVDSAIAQVLPSLPANTSYTVRRMDVTVYPVIAYGITSDSLPQSALRDIARYQLVPLLSSIRGVARVGVQGGAEAEVHVLVEPHRLHASGVSVAELTGALAKSNTLQAVGRLADHHKLYLVVSSNVLHRLDQVRNVVVRATPEGIVRLGDVAEVSMGTVPHWTVVTEDGKLAVLLNVYEQPSGNVVQIAKEVRQTLADFQMPPGVRVARWYDQSQLVTESEGSVRDAVVIGLLLAGLVMLLFLRSWRVTLVAIIVVPVTLLITVLMLSVMGLSFNIMTLGGIAAAVGLLIDDVIVMIEHIARRAGAIDHSAGEPAAARGSAAVLPAARKFLSPQSGSSLATIIVFVPLSFLSGVTGAFEGAVGDDGGGTADLLDADHVRGAGDGAADGQLQALA
jgi:multidrug efflux pump subunit AcrB